MTSHVNPCGSGLCKSLDANIECEQQCAIQSFVHFGCSSKGPNCLSLVCWGAAAGVMDELTTVDDKAKAAPTEAAPAPAGVRLRCCQDPGCGSLAPVSLVFPMLPVVRAPGCEGLDGCLPSSDHAYLSYIVCCATAIP